MSLIVNSNIAALNAQRNLGKASSKLAKSIERLSSGLRINKASDDAAGIAIASKFSAQVRGLNQAIRNSNNAITLTQTAEGGINTVTNILQRLRELAVQSSSDDNTSSDRANLVNESDSLVAELTRVVNTSEYNTMGLLDGSFSGKYFQVGANYSQNITFTISDTRGSAIGNIAEYEANVTDGVTTAINNGFTAGEITINCTNVAATNATDDQYSVINITSAALGAGVSAAISDAMNLSLVINGTAVTVTTVANSGITSTQLIASIVANINAAGITNVTARQVNDSLWTLEATGGTNLNLALTGSIGGTLTDISTLANSIMGMNAVSTMFGSGGNAEAVTNANGESSAIAKAAAINQVSTTSGVAATAEANIVAGSQVASGTIASGEVYINGVNLGAVTVAGSDTNGTLLAAFNAISSSTGVTATLADGAITLNATDGRNISITTATAGNATTMGLGSGHSNTTAIYRSTVKLSDNEAFSLGSTAGLGDLYDDGSSDNSTTETSANNNDVALDSTKNVASLSISTRASAQLAILIVDSALDKVNGIRAEIGAIQNRIEFTVQNLEIASENMSASLSRIMDADFASETSIFTRNQIMVQAATAILAQANTLPQLALQLLG